MKTKKKSPHNKKSSRPKTSSKSHQKPHQKNPIQKQQEAPTFSKLMEPAKTKFGLRNILQAIVGATVLAIPIGFTEETWRLGESLPMWNILIIFIISLLFITLFAYRNFKKNRPNFYWYDLLKRVFTIYITSFFIVALILLTIQKAPWTSDFILAFKRTIIVTFPSSLGATLAGSLK
jgi:uncharacterized membrane protein